MKKYFNIFEINKGICFPIDNVKNFSLLENKIGKQQKQIDTLNNVKNLCILDDKIEKQQKQINDLIKNQQIMTDKHNELVNRLLDRIVELSGKN